MDSDSAAVSSIATALDELTVRVAEIAERYEGTPRADLAADLYDVERALRAATRRLARVHEAMRSAR
jgi:hypothetical protein